MKSDIKAELDATNLKLDGLGTTITTEADEIKAAIEKLSGNVDDMGSEEIIAALRAIGDRADAMKAAVSSFVTPASTDPGPVPGEEPGDGTVPEQ